MKRKFLFPLLLVLLIPCFISTNVEASKKHNKTHKITSSSRQAAYHPGFGAGLILGEPSGFNVKNWMASDRAVDFGLAFSLNSYVLLYGDYLFHFPGVFHTSSDFINELNPYIGPGLCGLFRSSIALAFRFPLGIEWIIPRSPFGIFAEVVPGMEFIPATSGIVQAGVGARLYF